MVDETLHTCRIVVARMSVTCIAMI
jgi:hypothetical protein